MNQEEFTIGESDFNLNFKKSHINGCMDWGDLNPKAMLKLVEMKLMVLVIVCGKRHTLGDGGKTTILYDNKVRFDHYTSTETKSNVKDPRNITDIEIYAVLSYTNAGILNDDAQNTTCDSKKQENKSKDNNESNKMDEVVDKSTKGGNASTSVMSDDAQSTTCESKKQESKSIDNEESNKMDEVVNKSTKGGNTSTSVTSDDAQSTTCDNKMQENKSNDNEESNEMDEVVNISTKGGNASTSVTSDDAQSITCENKIQENNIQHTTCENKNRRTDQVTINIIKTLYVFTM